MELPFIAPVDPIDIGYIVRSGDAPYLAPATGMEMRESMARANYYALALLESLDDMEDLLEPQLPPEMRPCVEVIERFLRHRAAHHMAEWNAPVPPAADPTA